MSPDKDLVCEYFEAEFRPANRYLPGFKKGFVYAKHPFKGAEWLLSHHTNYPFEFTYALPENEAWAVAAEIVNEQLRKIAKLENDIAWLIATPHLMGDMSYNRILSLLTSTLKDLKRGMKNDEG